MSFLGEVFSSFKLSKSPTVSNPVINMDTSEQSEKMVLDDVTIQPIKRSGKLRQSQHHQ